FFVRPSKKHSATGTSASTTATATNTPRVSSDGACDQVKFASYQRMYKVDAAWARIYMR
ncbi:hypothetical protein LPJ73_007450, partial [Coemansia sp. RSA 2703]